MVSPVVPITPNPLALLPCPFCSCPAAIHGGGNSSHGRIPYTVGCSSTLCFIGTKPTIWLEQAVKVWNTRVNQ